jgi:hypothetical protein
MYGGYADPALLGCIALLVSPNILKPIRTINFRGILGVNFRTKQKKESNQIG